MILIKADTTPELAVKVYERFDKLGKEELQDVVMHVKDGSLMFANCPPVAMSVPVELQEIEDIMGGESVLNGMRYRYTTNPGSFRANGIIDWQYSQTADKQFAVIRELLQSGKLDDKGIVSFISPDRDLKRYLKRVDAGYDSRMRQRYPCGLIWAYRKRYRGFHVSITNRSIWVQASLSSDFHLPGVCGHLLGRPISSYDMIAYRVRFPRLTEKTNKDDFWMSNVKELMKDSLNSYLKSVVPYKPLSFDAFRKIQAGTEAARAGHFENAYRIAKELPKNSIHRDWICVIAIAERYLQKKWFKGNINYGVKSAVQTKALKGSAEFTPELFWELMTPTGTLKHDYSYLYLSPMIKAEDKNGVQKALEQLSGTKTHIFNSLPHGIFTTKLARKFGAK